MEIPEWMLKKNEYKIQIKSKTKFLAKTLKGLSGVMHNEIFSEKNVTENGYLQAIDPRVKLVTMLFFMIYCAFSNSFFSMLMLSAVAVCFVKLSKLDVKSYFKRVWCIIPPIVFVLSIPAATNLFIDGKPYFFIYKWVCFTYLGISAVTKTFLRIGNSLSFAYLLIMTTRWSAISKSFSVLRVPSLIITILNMAYRYIFVIAKSASDMMEARSLRTVGKIDNKSNRSFLAGRLSFLFVKIGYLSDEIYDAMRCRGFSGESVTLSEFKIKNTDKLWIINNVIIALVLIAGEFIF